MQNRAREFVRGCAFVCGAHHPRDRQGIVFICIYIGVSLRTLPCTLTRRRFPIFRPKLSTEKPRPSNPSLSLSPSRPPSRPRNPLSASRRPLPFSPRPSRSLAATLSYATSSRHIRTKSNVSRLNGFVSTVLSRPLSLRPPFRPLPLFRFSCRRRGRNIYYKPRVASGFQVSAAADKRNRMGADIVILCRVSSTSIKNCA